MEKKIKAYLYKYYSDEEVYQESEEFLVTMIKNFITESNLVENRVSQPSEPTCGKFIVRLYDGMDGGWMDVSEPVSEIEAQKIWNEKTKDGTKNICYDEIDYYKIFPADTQMLRKL